MLQHTGHAYEVVLPRPSREGRQAAGRWPAFAAVVLAVVAVAALAAHGSEANRQRREALSLALKNSADTQELLTIPGSETIGSRLAKHDSKNYCTIPGSIVGVSPPDFYCTDVGEGAGGSVDSCNDCSGSCLSPYAALSNRAITNEDGSAQDGDTFVGWNPQGGPSDNENQYVDIDVGGKGATIKALLWANAGDTTHDPAKIKVWSSDDGVTYDLVGEVDVSGLQGDGNITVVPVVNPDTRAKYWRINPMGIADQSIPRVMGLCNTEDCSTCLYEDKALPEQGYNVYGAIKPADCWDGAPNGNIYCLGNYDSDEDLNKKLTKSYTVPMYREDGYKR